MKENGFTLKNGRIRRYRAQTITNAAHADDISLLANKFTQAKSLLHSLEQVADDIGFHMNAYKMGYMCFIKKETTPH